MEVLLSEGSFPVSSVNVYSLGSDARVALALASIELAIWEELVSAKS
jgi:hypothetical protein